MGHDYHTRSTTTCPCIRVGGAGDPFPCRTGAAANISGMDPILEPAKTRPHAVPPLR
ncbi:hypothetical protein SAY87_021293 [Trapa incisa]|uniref:Uncharacterized protein n=1 Tax=Trapa incisa TaxID=236973 RepID=A0AAN7PVR2_9MYRT|nr:hypothetical protein SAY87_021293 [Trapa incisa]